MYFLHVHKKELQKFKFCDEGLKLVQVLRRININIYINNGPYLLIVQFPMFTHCTIPTSQDCYCNLQLLILLLGNLQPKN
jgi:hypothetical protein